MTRELRVLSLYRIVGSIALLWAVAGTMAFNKGLDYLGYGSMDFESRVLLYGGFTVLPVLLLIIVAVSIGLSQGKRNKPKRSGQDVV